MVSNIEVPAQGVVQRCARNLPDGHPGDFPTRRSQARPRSWAAPGGGDRGLMAAMAIPAFSKGSGRPPSKKGRNSTIFGQLSAAADQYYLEERKKSEGDPRGSRPARISTSGTLQSVAG